MEYQYKLIVKNQRIYKEFEITQETEQIKIGTTLQCDYKLDKSAFFSDIELSLSKREKTWELACNDGVYLNKGDMLKQVITEIKHGDIFKLKYSDTDSDVFEIRFIIDFEAVIPKYNWFVDLSEKNSILIGDTLDCDIRLQSSFSKNSKIRITYQNNRTDLEEISNQYGVFLNGKQIEGQTQICDYDFFAMADYSFYYKEGKIYFDAKELSSGTIRIKQLYESSIFDYPKFVRNTRLKLKNEEEPINILDPEKLPTKPETNIIVSLLPAIAMFALVVILRGVMNSTGGGFVIFSICSMGLGVFTSVMSIITQRRKYKKTCKERVNKYEKYIDDKKEEIKEAHEKELKCLESEFYSIEEDVEHIKRFDYMLFDRVPEDEDFMEIYLGVGKKEALRKIDYKLQETLESGDNLAQLPTQLSNELKYIENAPITVALKEANAVGVVGTKENRYAMFKNFIIDIISRQYFGEVGLYVFLDDKEEKFEWLRTIPHLQNGEGFRNIVCDDESKNNIFEYLYKELSFRSASKTKNKFNIVMVLDEFGIKSHPVSKFVENASEIDTVFVFFEKSEEFLPLHCSTIIRLDDECHGVVFESGDASKEQLFEYKTVSDEEMFEISDVLSPVYCEEISLESSLRKNVSLYDILGIYSAEDMNLGKRWASSKIDESIAVPIGVNAKGEIVYLDIHEKYHGPHGLVAGTTGSGKSELLQSYIIAAASLYHPHEIGFMIIDFKGGGMVNQFKKLPHLIGSITNIDGNEIDRSLKSIKAELIKRQTLFAKADVNHIDKYIKLYKEGKVKEALPHLVIVVDEFAELKAEQPEFMKELISAARIGRSLGVHLILATQKPAGQVNEQIWSNSRFKLCLKVQTQEDSNEVLKSPLAAEIREPGRAYIQVGNDEIFELFQSGYSGKPESQEYSRNKAYHISEVDFKGIRKTIFNQIPDKNAHSVTQLEATVEYIEKYCEENNISKLNDICMEPLPEIVDFPKSIRDNVSNGKIIANIGICDDPDNQTQTEYSVDLTNENVLIIGSARTGKTNLLQSVIRNTASKYSPKEVTIYVMDFASMILKKFEKLKHVGGVVTLSEDEKLKNLLKLLESEKENRKKIFADMGVSSYTAYKEAGKCELPQIVLIVDNLMAFREIYTDEEAAFLNICREGLSVGISIVVSNAQTAGIGYKYLSNFSTRIAMYCNDSDEYNQILDHCRLRIEDIKGRCIIEKDSRQLECQSYLAFEGEKEIERAADIVAFVEKTNENYIQFETQKIPVIPDVLSKQHIIEESKEVLRKGYEIPFGLDYDTVKPFVMDIASLGSIATTGKTHDESNDFIIYIVEMLNELYRGKTEVRIIDGVEKKLNILQESENVISYDTIAENSAGYISWLDSKLSERYDAMISGETKEPYDEKLEVLVINNFEAIKLISEDAKMLGLYKNIIGKYKGMKGCVIVGGFDNTALPYGSPEILRIFKDTKHVMFFENIPQIKMFEIDMATRKHFTKPLKSKEGYYIEDSKTTKIKTITL